MSKSSLRLTGTIEARDDLASSVDHLGLYVRPKTSERIVKDRRGPRRVEGWPLDLMPGGGLLKIWVFPRVDKGVVPGHGRLQHRR